MNKQNVQVKLLVIMTLLVSLGFPGNYTNLLGSMFGTLAEYSAFLLQIAVMLISSGEHLMDFKLIDLKNKYKAVYFFLVLIFVESMLVTRFPSAQLVTCIRFTVTGMFALWLVEQFDVKQIVEMVCIAQGAFDLLTVLFMVIAPGTAFETGSTYVHALRGFYQAKNVLANELTFGTAMELVMLKIEPRKRTNRVWLWLLALRVILLVLCQATGALLCMIVVGGYLIYFERIRLPLGWLYVGGSVGFLFGAMTILPLFSDLLEMLGKDVTITGRTPLWEQIISVMTSTHTWTGFGYGMFWRDSAAYELIHAGFDKNSFMGNMTTGAHNNVLEMWLNVGLIGLGAYFSLILFAMRNTREMEAGSYLFSSAYMLYLMQYGLTERAITGTYDYKLIMLFVVMGLGCNRPISPYKKRYLLLSREAKDAKPRAAHISGAREKS